MRWLSGCSDAGGEAVAKVTDVSRRGDLMDLVSLATDTYGRLDVLVSNAGIMPVSPFDELRVDDWEAMVDVNLKGVLFGIAAALPVFPSPARWTFRQHRLHGGIPGHARSVGVRGHQDGGPHDIGGTASGSRREPAGDDHLARHDIDELRRVGDRIRPPGPSWSSAGT